MIEGQKDPNEMEDIIIKYLMDDELTKQELEEFNQWVEVPNNRALLTRIQQVWFQGGQSPEQIKNQVWGELKSKVNDSTNHENIESTIIQPQWMRMARVAAVMVFAFFLGYMVHEYSQQPETVKEIVERMIIEKHTQFGEKKTVFLPDGSAVKMNAGSYLTYPKSFEGDIREVTLEGEAFFDVKKNPNKPFIVHFNNLDVRVKGTSFNIRSYSDEAETQVAVKTGAVLVTSANGSAEFLLERSDILTNYKASESFQKNKINNEDLIFGWKDRRLVFEEASLVYVIGELERWYGVRFDVKLDQMPAEKFNGKYQNPTIEQVMLSLSYAYKLKYEIYGEKVILTD